MLRIQKCGAAAPGNGARNGSVIAATPSTSVGAKSSAKAASISYQRPHHPVHAALNGHGPYIAVLVELPE
jgi:hypothetical protein